MTITLREIYPDSTEEERADAKRRLTAYLGVILEIADKQAPTAVDEPADQAYDEDGRALPDPNNQHSL